MAVPTATVDGLPESVFPYAVVVTSVRPLDRKWAYRTLAYLGAILHLAGVNGKYRKLTIRM